MDPADATAMATEIETALQARSSLAAGGGASEGYYEEFDPGPPVDLALAREWVGDGGMWAADSPKLMFEMFEAFERSGLRRVIHGYLNEIPAISIEKCTLRRVMPDSASAWHQDGAFLGRVRALNVWMSLSRCGDLSPGLDVVPERLEEIVPTGTEGAIFNWSVSPQVVEGVTSRDRCRAADLRARRRAAVRRDEPALDRRGPVDAEPALRDRKLVLRPLGVPGRVRTDRLLGGKRWTST